MKNKLEQYIDCVYPVVFSDENIIKLLQDYPAADEEYVNYLKIGGLHVFSKSLRIFGLTNDKNALNVLYWNNPDTWKKEYNGFFHDIWSFAEDVFGYQYAFGRTGVLHIDIETGKTKEICRTFSEWIEVILHDIDYYTGFSVAQLWEKEKINEPLSGIYHLCPITPFVCGGKYEIDNLFRCEARKHLRIMSQLAKQIRDLPDGTQITIDFE